MKRHFFVAGLQGGVFLRQGHEGGYVLQWGRKEGCALWRGRREESVLQQGHNEECVLQQGHEDMHWGCDLNKEINSILILKYTKSMRAGRGAVTSAHHDAN
jgi:hypothetical protein